MQITKEKVSPIIRGLSTRTLLEQKVVVLCVWVHSYVTRIRSGSRVSHIRYVSDTDTCPIRPGYVSLEYPNFFYFRELWIRGLIRISLVDTSQPSKQPFLCPRRPREERIDRESRKRKRAARSAARIRDIPVRRSRLRAPSSPIRLTGTAAPLSAPSCLSHCRRFAWPSEPLPSASTADSPEAARRYLHSPGTARRRRRLKLLAPRSEAGLGLGPESGLGIWGWLKSRVVAWCRWGLAEVKSALYVDFGGPSLGWT